MAVIFHAPFSSHSFWAMTFWWIIFSLLDDSIIFISQPFSKAHFKLFLQKAHPYLNQKKGHPVSHPSKTLDFPLRTLAPPQVLQLGGFPRLQATMLSRLFRGCQGLRMVGGVTVSVRFKGISWPVVFGKMLWKYDNLLKDLFVFVGYGYRIIFFKIMMF